MKLCKTYTINGIEEVETYSAYDYPYNNLIASSEPNSKNYKICHTYGTFDIETTSIREPEPYAYMYHWQTCIDGIVTLGRTWEEFMFHVKQLCDSLNINQKNHLVIYVHNLSYEFQFIKSFYEWDDVFARSKRQILRATTTTGLEFRCSYLLSNKSLEKFCEEENVMHQKVTSNTYSDLDGITYDYSKRRTSTTPLSESEIAYCINDVLGLYEAIQSRLKNDTLKTIPMTSTGYVRREVRTACFQEEGYKREIKKLSLNLTLYTLMKEAFRGGDTHANGLYTGEICENIESYDKASSYPYQIMAKKFPMSKFIRIKSDKFYEYLSNGKYAMIFRVRFQNIDKKDEFGFPYISTSKTRIRKNIITDNGRILSAELIEMTITDIDFMIIKDQYIWDNMWINDLYISKYDYLPEPIRKETLEYFYRKTTLKHKDSEEYMKSKNKLNAIYGMMVTDIINDEYIYDRITYEINSTEGAEPQKQLSDHYNSRNLFLAYQWGIWTTAHARYDLHVGRKAVEELNTLYNDTDSLKTFPGQHDKIEAINKEIISHCESLSIIPKVEYEGEIYYMGVWEYEGSYQQFRTWGSKKYAYVDKKGIHTTISGVSKKRGKETLEMLGGIEYFKPGLIITKCGNMTGYYNEKSPHEILVDGCKMLSGSNLALFESDYQLGLTKEYEKLIPFFQTIC